MSEIIAALIGVMGSLLVARSSNPSSGSNSTGTIKGSGNSVSQSINSHNVDNSTSIVNNAGPTSGRQDSDSTGIIFIAAIAGIAGFGLLVWAFASAGEMIASVAVGLAVFIFGSALGNSFVLARNSRWCLGSLVLVILSGAVMVLMFRVAAGVRARLVPGMREIFENSPGEGVAVLQDGKSWFAADEVLRFQTIGFLLAMLLLLMLAILIAQFAIQNRNSDAPRWFSMKISQGKADSVMLMALIVILSGVVWVLFLPDPGRFFGNLLDSIVNAIDGFLN